MIYTKDKDHLDQYAEYLFRNELSEGTISIYRRQAALLLEYLQGRPITKEGMLEYKKFLTQQRKKPATVNLYIVAVNSYLRYAGYQDCTIKTAKVQRNRCLENVISAEEYRKMSEYARESGRIKYYYIIRVLVFTGIRIGELASLTVEVLSLGKFTVENKGKLREVYLPPRLTSDLSAYCREQQIETGVIFRGKGQKPIGRTAVYKMFLHLADMTGVEKKKAHPHSFRHLFAITYMRQYADLTELADILGHSNLETTRIYTATTAEEKRRKLDGLEF